MNKFLSNQLPAWAQETHPVMRYERTKDKQQPKMITRVLRAFGLVLVLATVMLASYMWATQFLTQAPGQHPSEILLNVLRWPLFGLQIIASVAAITMTAGTVGEEVRRQTWDTLRTTSKGTEMFLRARWWSVFKRLSPLLALIFVLRVVLIGALIFEVTAFRGVYLERLLANADPIIAPLVGVGLLAMLLTASVLLVFAGVGLDASLGILISTTFTPRLGVVAQAAVTILRVALALSLLILFEQLKGGTLIVDPNAVAQTTGAIATNTGGAWFVVLFFGGFADWGMSFLNLSLLGEIWRIVPYTVYIGAALLAFAFIQAALSDVLLMFAVHRAERRG
jgi:hypothetical protein